MILIAAGTGLLITILVIVILVGLAVAVWHRA